jgi:hypothetical protein
MKVASAYFTHMAPVIAKYAVVAHSRFFSDHFMVNRPAYRFSPGPGFGPMLAMSGIDRSFSIA